MNFIVPQGNVDACAMNSDGDGNECDGEALLTDRTDTPCGRMMQALSASISNVSRLAVSAHVQACCRTTNSYYIHVAHGPSHQCVVGVASPFTYRIKTLRSDGSIELEQTTSGIYKPTTPRHRETTSTQQPDSFFYLITRYPPEALLPASMPPAPSRPSPPRPRACPGISICAVICSSAVGCHWPSPRVNSLSFSLYQDLNQEDPEHEWDPSEDAMKTGKEGRG
ncbi:hypothetical protein BD779DRAFT_1473542 [Infundibulicybe gibba]|nr:hypothetical protein BD779DRAFT_1473542 [Infundibulicybe gibba]